MKTRKRPYNPARRIYSIFEMDINAKGKVVWNRISPYAFTKTKAVRLFQNMLLEPYLSGQGKPRELRVVGHEFNPFISMWKSSPMANSLRTDETRS